MAAAALLCAGMFLAATLATSSAQTPGSYGLHDGKANGKAFSFTLPKADPAVPAPSMAEGLKVTGFLKPPTVPGLVLSLFGALHPLNLTQLAGNITTQCPPIQKLLNHITASDPKSSGLVLVGDCPAGLHARCSTCQVSLAGPSQCLACFSPFVLHHENNFCGCAIGSTLARDPASQQETCVAASGPSDLQLEEERRQRLRDGQDYGPYYGYGTGADPLLQPTFPPLQQQQG